MKNFLIAEDEPMQRTLLASILKKRFNASVDQAENGKQAILMIKESNNDYDMAIMDLHMPEVNGLEALEVIKQYKPDLPVMMLTGSEDVENAVHAMKIGAYDYVKKPLDPEHLCVSIKNALRLKDLDKELARLKRNEDGVTKFSDLIGYNSGLSKVVDLGRKGASAEVPIMITGETGVGKELFARAIHGESNRFGKPFIAVNCGAIPSQLVESVLFGHEKGSFTGASNKTLGKFREANGGTLFLDEVGELPIETQVKLLRALQQKEVEPVGAGKPVNVDVRIISATNRDLQKEVSEGNFREDLYFRLDVFPIRIPPLRERIKDVKLLANHFISSYSVLNKTDLKELSYQALQTLENNPWRGNVRELKNKIDRLMITSSSNLIDIEDIKNISIKHNNSEYSLNNDIDENFNEISEHPQRSTLYNESGDIKPLKQIETEAIKNALKHTNNNITKASELLGIAKSTFYRKIKNLKIQA